MNEYLAYFSHPNFSTTKVAFTLLTAASLLDIVSWFSQIYQVSEIIISDINNWQFQCENEIRVQLRESDGPIKCTFLSFLKAHEIKTMQKKH